MRFLPWLSAHAPGPRPGPTSRKRRRATVPALEPLEDRCLLSFGTGGTVFTDFGGDDRTYDLAIQPNGMIVAVGVSTTGGGAGSATFALARYTSAGSLDTAFDRDGKVSTSFKGSAVAYAVALQPDGKILAF